MNRLSHRRKLSLNRETMRALTDQNLVQALGGKGNDPNKTKDKSPECKPKPASDIDQACGFTENQCPQLPAPLPLPLPSPS